MNELRLLAIERLYLLWLLPLLVAVMLYAAQRRKRALLRFAEADLLRRINNSLLPARRRWKALMVLGGFALIVLGLARPAWNPVEEEVQRRGRAAGCC